MIYLIRHGETDWNVERRVMGRTDVPLNANGKQQASALGSFLSRLPLDHVFTSPQLRARQTAEFVVGDRGARVEVHEGLAEVDFPKWIGKTWEELQFDPDYQIYHERKMDLNHSAFEPTQNVQKRVVQCIEECVASHKDKVLAFVSHADPVRAAISHGLMQPLEHFRKFRVYNASLTVFEEVPEKWIMTLFNFRTDPLPENRLIEI